MDQEGIGNCPKCQQWIHEDMSYCGHCGALLSLPATVQDFISREESEEKLKLLAEILQDIEDPFVKLLRAAALKYHNHQEERKWNFKFCTKCGKKL